MGMEKIVFNFVGIESECNTGEGLRIYCLFSQKLEGIFKQPIYLLRLIITQNANVLPKEEVLFM